MFRFSILLLFAIGSFGLVAQPITGMATYHFSPEVSIDVSGNKKISPEQRASLQSQLKKALGQEFELSFNNSESVYQTVETLDREDAVQSGMTAISLDRSANMLYKDISEKEYVYQQALRGKGFLVKGSLELPAWELQEDYKTIAGYKCQKATCHSYTRKTMDLAALGKTEKQIVSITAWFTTAIPVSNGPAQYWGLPGLIMEVQEGNATITCTRVSLNPETLPAIHSPKRGRGVTEDEFREISRKELQEFTQGMNGEGKTVTIQVGGE